MADHFRQNLIAPVLAVFITALAVPALAQAPLSASDWLSGTVKTPPREASGWQPGDKPPSGIAGQGNPLPVASSAAVGVIEVTRLGRTNPDIAGIITARNASLPKDLWEGSESPALRDLILQTPSRLPAMNALLRRILTAQLSPPSDTTDYKGLLFLTRVDRLLDMAALDQSHALLLTAGHGNDEVFRRLFDIALLKGDEAGACEIMNNTPGIAPSLSARIFCLAQSGDWAAAAIGLNGADDLGLIPEQELQLLTHFLHDSYVDSGESVEVSERITPLEFRIYEAIGQPLPTQQMPLAFAHSDLRGNTGWKARLEAAERLARESAIPAKRMREIYAEQKPAASGGVWERAGAMRTLEAAIAANDVSSALPAAFDEFSNANMIDVLAGMVAEDLPDDSTGRAAKITDMLRQWEGLAGNNPMKIDPALLTEAQDREETSKGEALLEAMTDIDAGIDGDLPRAARGIASLRKLGLNGTADQAAAQLTLLPHLQDSL